jgi:hypothetical protein
VLARRAADEDRRAVAVDLFAQGLNAVEGLAGERQHLTAGFVGDVVRGHDPVPQGAAVVTQLPRRFRSADGIGLDHG